MGSLPTVLVVDDHQETVHLLAKCLEKISICTLKAFDGKSGWEQFQANEPELVITDFTMPYLDGVELAKLIKNKSPQTKIFLVSGYNGKKKIDTSLFDKVFSKPFNVRSLQQSVMAIIE